MTFRPFSERQKSVLTWWTPASVHRDRDAVICDGAVRSGKTLCTGVSFFLWAMFTFTGRRFGLCGKTIGSLRRNLLSEVLPALRESGFDCREQTSKNQVTVSYAGRENTFYLFGGRDEGSAALIQGVTLAGVLMDEVVLMPRSFVEQACARCSVTGSKLWFSCNPGSPHHWFYREWIAKAEEKNALYLHFTLQDNPGLSPAIIARYERMYTGVFYERFILGKWVAGEGLVYDFFDQSYLRPVPAGPFTDYRVSCDYGTVNPASFGLWGRQGETWYRLREYYYDSRRHRAQKTDAEYVQAMNELTAGLPVSRVIVDPSAASFILALRRAGYPVEKADNQVLTGIRLTADALKSGALVICESCHDAIREFSLYRWADGGTDAPVKEYDHAMDDIRYFAASLHRGGDDFAALSVSRRP